MTYLRAHRGDSETYDITLVDEDSNPLDLDLVDSITFSVRDGYDGGLLVEKTLSDGITVTDADAGEATIALVPEDTDDFPDHVANYPFDVQVVVSGDTTTAIRGRLRVSPDVSR